MSLCHAGYQTAIHVQSTEGDTISAIDTQEALEAAVAGCNRKGNRERALQTALKQTHSKLKGPLQAGHGVSSQPQAAESTHSVVNGADQDTIEVDL